MKRAIAAGLHDARVDEPLEVVAQRGSRDLYASLNRPGRGALWTRLYDKAQNGQAQRVSERAELLGMMLKLRVHTVYF